MPEHAFRCVCGQKTRIYFPLEAYPYPDALPCACGGQLVRFFERAPGMAPDVWNPTYDHALGAWVTSRRQREEIAKEKGLAIMGKEEYERSRKAHVPKDEFTFSPEEKKLLHESAEKAWNDLHYGNVEAPETPTVDMADVVVSNG